MPGQKLWIVPVALLVHVTGAFGQTNPISRVAWLAGCWEMRAGALAIEEQWSAPRAGTMLGTSRTVRDGTLLGYEFVRIYAREDSLVYAAHPSGQAPAEFVATSAGGREIVFENPVHDFPQRVRYRALGPDSLLARVEGVRNGQPGGSDFPYARVACPGSGDP